MNQTMLTLKTGVKLIERNGQMGLTLDGCTKLARDEPQAAILRILVEELRPLESLMAFLHVREGPPKSDNDNPLAIAEFILDFSEYLEA